jgi:hypothetical protein
MYVGVGIDFDAYYYAGKSIFLNPALVYSEYIIPQFVYLPGFACLFAPLSMLPYEVALIVYFIILAIFSELSLFYLDKILTLKKVGIEIKFAILMIISGGAVIILNFELLQTKFIVSFLVLLFLKREIEKKQNKDLKFYIIQLFLIAVIVSILPYMVFIALIYLFHRENRFLKSIQIKKILIFSLELLIINIIFLIYPLLISDFFERILNQFLFGDNYILHHRALPIMVFYYADNLFNYDIPWDSIGGIISISMVIINTLYHSYSREPLEIKIGRFFLIFLLMSSPFYPWTHYAVLIPLILLLFLDSSKYNSFALLLIFCLYYIQPVYNMDGLDSLTSILLFPFYILLRMPNLIYLLLLFILLLKKCDTHNPNNFLEYKIEYLFVKVPTIIY